MYTDKKVGCSVSGICRYIVCYGDSLDNFALVIGDTRMENREEAQEVCDYYAENYWNCLLTDEQREELRAVCTRGLHEYDEAEERYMKRNREAAKKVFWELWESGKLYQPRLESARDFGAPCSGLYESVEAFVEYVETEVLPVQKSGGLEGMADHTQHVLDVVRARFNLA